MSADDLNRRQGSTDSLHAATSGDDFNILRLPTDRTLALTWGRWGGFYKRGHKGFWRVCLGWVAVTFIHDEFTAVLRAYLDRLEAEGA